MRLLADCDHDDYDALLFHIVEHPPIPDAQFPDGKRVGAEQLAVSCRGCRLVGELFLDRVEDDVAVPGAEAAQVALGVLTELDSVGHGGAPHFGRGYGLPPCSTSAK